MREQKASRGASTVMFLFAGLILALLLPLRIWQQLYLIESNGFWTSANHATVYALYAALVVLFAVPLIAAIAFKGNTVLDFGRRRRIWEGVAALLVAIALAVDAYIACKYAIQLFKNFGVHQFEMDFEPLASSPVQYFIRSGTIAALMETVFGVMGAVFFANLALVDVMPQKKVFLNRLTALAPLLWVISRLLRRFARTISYLRISDLFLDILLLVAFLAFFLAFAQLISDINSEGKAPRLFAFGIPAVVLSIITFVPRAIAYFFAANSQPQDAMIEWSSPLLALFIVVLLAGRLLTAAGGQAATAVLAAGEGEAGTAEDPSAPMAEPEEHACSCCSNRSQEEEEAEYFGDNA